VTGRSSFTKPENFAIATTPSGKSSNSDERQVRWFGMSFAFEIEIFA